jgi:MFS transporter, PPP family, 3-phenylpropionic acid transporter
VDTLNKSLLSLRAFYLFTGLSGGLLAPYLSLLLEHDHFQNVQIGLIMAIGTAVQIVVQPLWGYVVDRYQVTRFALAMSCFVPGLVAVVFDVKWLWLVVFVNSISNLFSAPQAPIADTFAVTYGRQWGVSYGSIRLFGSIGAALGGFLCGHYLTIFPITTLFIPYTILALLGAAVAIQFPKLGTDSVVARSVNFRSAMFPLLRDKAFLCFLTGGFLVTQTLTAFNTYFAEIFQKMGGSTSNTGIAFLLASGTNVPAMMLGRRIIERIGHERTMVIASIAYIIRWSVEALVPNPWVAVLIQVFQGISFGLYYVAAVDYVSKTASKELQATAQSIFGMICGGLAGIVGNLLNGWLLTRGGGPLMYWSCTVSSVLGMFAFLAAQKFGTKKGQQHVPTKSELSL